MTNIRKKCLFILMHNITCDQEWIHKQIKETKLTNKIRIWFNRFKSFNAILSILLYTSMLFSICSKERKLKYSLYIYWQIFIFSRVIDSNFATIVINHSSSSTTTESVIKPIKKSLEIFFVSCFLTFLASSSKQKLWHRPSF